MPRNQIIPQEYWRKTTTPEIFWKKFNPAPAPEHAKHLGDCWLWTGASKDNGNGVRYGVTSVDYKQWLVHRLAWFWTHGEIPKGLQIRHICDVGICFRPSHLLLGTAQNNANDRVERNRQSQGAKHAAALAPNKPKGEKHFRAQFTDEGVREIRRLFETEKIPYSQLAKRFGVSSQSIGKVIRRERWNHVT